MRLSLSIAIVLAWVMHSAVAHAQVAQEPGPIPSGTASIGGRVIDRESRRPLEHVIVRLTSPDGRRIMTALTGSDGQYLFEAIAGGAYELAVMLDGYVPQRYGRSADPSRRDEIIRVDAGQTRRLLDLSLSRGGTITGRVTDAQGRPLKDAGVDALPIDDGAALRFENFGLRPRTNAGGEYTVENLPAGNYYVAVHWIDPELLNARVLPEERIWMHPDVSRRADATAVRLAAGETVRNIDVVVHRRQRFRLTGHFVRGGASGPIEAHLLSKGQSIRTIKVDANGAFDLTHVEPGVHTIWARCQGDGLTDVAVMTVQIESDLPDLTLPLLAAGRLTGRILTADGGPLPEGPLYLNAILAAGGQEIDPLPRDRVEIASDGSFDLSGVLGERKLAVTGLDPTWVIDHVRHGRSPVQSLTIQPGAELHDLTVVLGRR